MIIEKHPTWDIQDASKVKCFEECARKYFFNYVLGWESDVPNNHLSFGTAWHEAMEHLLLNGYSDESILPAFELFLASYRKDFPESTDELFSPKTPKRALEALVEYCQKYKNDLRDFDVLYTEVAGSVPLSEDRMMHFRQDAICKGSQGYFSLEHKTAGATIGRAWMQQWPLSVQVGTYTHVLYCLFPQEEVYGVKINGVGFLKTKFSMERVPVKKGKESMQVWMWNTLYWLDQIQNEFLELENCKESDPVLMCYPMRDSDCSKYFGCPYHDFCTAWANPLQHLDQLPIGIQVRYWNPMDRPMKHKVEGGVLVE